MNAWTVATEAAIWILIGGSLAVFIWFLTEVRRLAGRRPPSGKGGGSGTHDGGDGDQAENSA